MLDTTSLISTKFYLPEGVQDRVFRPRLIEQINCHLQAKMTLIAAPAGSGKTTLIREWFDTQHDSLQLAWLALDSDDNDPVRMLRYLLAAVQQALPHLDAELDSLKSLSQAQIKDVLTNLLNRISSEPERLVLVLDDYHLIENKDVHVILIFLLDYLPRNMHLILTTRSDPPLPLARLRARRQLLEIRADDLRFTVDETHQFLNQIVGLNLTPEQIDAIGNRTEGWVAGLQLAALSMRDKSDIDEFITSFTGNNRYIVDYLLEEVFEQLDEQIRHFLLCTSIVEPFCASMSEYLTDNPQSRIIIDRLLELNLFIIPLDAQGKWYRYHHLFADVLRFRLERNYSPEQQQRLYSLASAWCEQNNQYGDAIGYAIAGKNWSDAVRLLEHYSDYYWFRGELKHLLRWSDQLPVDFVRDSAALCVLKAWTILPSGDLESMETYLLHAERSLAGDKRSVWYGRMLSLRAFLIRIRDGGDSGYTMTVQAKSQLAPDDYVWQAFTTMNLSSSAMMSGDLPAFIQYNDETRKLAKHGGDVHTYITSSSLRAQVELDRGQWQSASHILLQMQHMLERHHAQQAPIMGFAHIVAGRIAYEENDLDRAKQHFELALQYGLEGDVADIIIDGFIWSSRVRQVTGQVERSGQYLASLREFISDINVTWTHHIVDAYEVYQHLLTGNLEAIEHWVITNQERIYSEPIALNWWFHTQHFCLIRAYLALGSYEQARRHIEYIRPAVQQYGEESALLSRLEVLHVLLALYQQDIGIAKVRMKRILTYSSLPAFSRIILDDLDALKPILKTLSAEFPILAQWLMNSEKHKANNLAHPDLLDPLSERELEVLAQLPQVLSNQELAMRLYVSVNTIKWHLKEIYSKLGVNNRTQAIEKARLLQLIP